MPTPVPTSPPAMVAHPEMAATANKTASNPSLRVIVSSLANIPSRWPPTMSAALHQLHTPPILPSHLVQRLGDLTERAHAHGFHQLGEHVSVIDHHPLQSLQRRRR